MRSICYVHKDISTIDRGGLCLLFKTLARGLKRNGWDVSIITTQELEMDEVIPYVLPKIEDPYEYSKEITKFLKKIEPNIVECSTWRFELLDYSRNTNRTSKIVVRCDPSASTLFPGVTKSDKGEKELCQNADLLLAVSKFAKQDIERKYLAENIKVVYNGIDEIERNQLSNKFLGSGEILHPDKNSHEVIKGLNIGTLINDKNKIYVFWVGKPTKMKGFDLLERIIEESGEDIQFIVNTGYAFDEVRWKTENYKKCLFIRGLSKIDQLTLFAACDVFLSTSRTEGFGIAVAEALSLGLPVILNRSCRVFKEFLPNQAVHLINANDPKEVIYKIKKKAESRVNYSRNPQIFTSGCMVKESLEAYLSIL